MAASLRTQANGTAYSTGNLASAAFNVSAGDLIIVGIGTQDLGGNCYCNGLSDTAGNGYTLLAASTETIGGGTLVSAYCLNSAAQANNVVTATFINADNCRKNIIVSVYQPDAGDTFSFDDNGAKSSGYEASPWETGTIDTTGDDEVVCAHIQASSTVTYSNHEIPSATAATALTDPGTGFDGWYRILAATALGLAGEIDPSGSQRYCAEIVAFKATASGISIPVAMHHYMRNIGSL